MLNGCLRLDMLRTKVELETGAKLAKDTQRSETSKLSAPMEAFVKAKLVGLGFMKATDNVSGRQVTSSPANHPILFSHPQPHALHAAQLVIKTMLDFMQANQHFLWGGKKASGRVALVAELHGKLHCNDMITHAAAKLPLNRCPLPAAEAAAPPGPGPAAVP